ncbi:MAG TPA: hypothetical protein VMJ75_23650 [Candidatus Acidoferrales bacterium]|nr:hypothetical protein [Candidatus Acidoferrales bacterium]
MHALERARLQRLRRIAQRVLQGAEDQRQRRAKLVADVGEHLRLEPVDLLEPLHRLCKLLPLLLHRSLQAALFGYVPALDDKEPRLPARVERRPDTEVDDDRLRAAFAAVDHGVVADELALRRPSDPGLEILLGGLRALPPAGVPKRLPMDVRSDQAGAHQRGVVRLPNVPLEIAEALKLEAVVQRHAG